MPSLETWWEICKVAGSGAALVLGPMCWLLWQAREKDLDAARSAKEKDQDYIRQLDKDTLKVLGGLTKVLESGAANDENRHQELLNSIQACVETLKAHIDGKPGRA